MTTRTEISESCIAIVGVGLIGGSIGAALKANGFAGEIIGCGRNAKRLNGAKSLQQIDTVATDVAAISDRPSLWVFCTPVNHIADGIRQAAALSQADAVFTDAGSTKKLICEEVGSKPGGSAEFVGSHPLAGSEKNGYEHAEADLFENKTCVVTPTAENTESATERVERFWQGLGMRVISSTPADHDRLLATTSHLPHVAAAALAALLDEPKVPFAATGFADTTRIAEGDPDLWTAILSRNSHEVVLAIQQLQKNLAEFKTAVTNQDEAAIKALLAAGQHGRSRLD